MPLCYYVLCVVREPVQESTLNFKCPVVVNPDSRRAIQVILNRMPTTCGIVWRSSRGKGGHPMLILGRKAGESLTIGGYQYHGSLCGLRRKCGAWVFRPQRDADPPQRAAAGRLLQPRRPPRASTPQRLASLELCVPQGGGCNPAVGSVQMILKDWRQVE